MLPTEILMSNSKLLDNPVSQRFQELVEKLEGFNRGLLILVGNVFTPILPGVDRVG
jgi:hypothetical protein